MSETSTVTRFGPYELQLSSRELLKSGRRIKLRPQPFRVLSVLLDHAGEVVSRDALRQQLWPSDTFVDFEHGLNTSIKELRAVLDDSPTEPRYIQTLPKFGYRFIFPVEQPVSATDQVPRGSKSPGSAPLPSRVVASPSDRNRKWLVAFGAMVLVGLGIAVTRLGMSRHSATGAASASVKTRPSIAVLGFKNLSREPDADWMSTAMAEMLGAEFASGQQIRVIPSENVSRMKRDLTFTPGDTFAQDTLAKIHNQLGTDMIASGSFFVLSAGPTAKLRIIFQVQDGRTGETIATITEDGTESNLPELISAGGDNLRRTLGIGSLSANDAREVRASIPANSKAERFYAEGLVRLQGFDFIAARDLFEKAIAADPSHALSHSALAESLSHLGYDSSAQVEAKKALDLASHVSREERLSIEGRYHELNHEREATVETYRTLYNFLPDNIDYGVRLARAQTSANHASDALQTIAALRKLPEPISADPRIDLQESAAAERLGDMKRSQTAAALAIAQANALGSRLLLGEALSREAWAWSNLGEQDKAIDDESRARDFYAAAGDTYEAAISLNGIGMYQQHKGDFKQARKSLETALAEFHRVGAQWEIASCANHLGEVFQEIGDLDQAKSYFEEAFQIDRAINDKRSVAADLVNLSSVEMSVGRLALAQKMNQEAFQSFQDIGDRRAASITTFYLGEVLYQRGKLAAAREKYQQAIATEKEISYKTGLAYSLVGLAEVQTAQDQLNDALASTQESMTLRGQTKEETGLAEGNVQLAVVATEQGRPADAESLARKAVVVFERHNSPASGSLAYAVLARSLLAQGKFAEARAAADSAGSLAQKGIDHMVRMQAGIASAEVQIQLGRASDAESYLDALLRQAKGEGYVVFEFEARLLLGKAQLKSGNIAAARESLTKLQSDARARGFLLMARKAQSSLPH